ncbi:MAG TPA: class I SAM-dependent methyltransferase [archaeon]|nr:class I SAM-dependent methyltransferase [archaeon]
MASEIYDQYIKVTEKGTQGVLAEFLSILPQMGGKKILDVGCGTGLLTMHYTVQNEVTGIDSNSKSVEGAKKNSLLAKLHDLEKPLPFKDNYFDLVVCKDVLEFITNANQLLLEIVRVTKPGGLVLLHVPNEFTLLDIAGYILGKGILKTRWYKNSSELTNPHIRFFTKIGLENSLKQKGLIVQDYSHKWAFTLPLIKIKPYLLSRISPQLFSPGITLLCTKKAI